MIHARAEFDTPAWDDDHLRVWSRDAVGRDQLIDEWHTDPAPTGLETLVKLSALCTDVWRAARGDRPAQPFAGLDQARALQEALDDISRRVSVQPTHSFHPPARYVHTAERAVISPLADLESLG